jgi:hypothetical protein
MPSPAGTVLLDADGNVILDEDGNVMVSDGVDDCDCCNAIEVIDPCTSGCCFSNNSVVQISFSVTSPTDMGWGYFSDGDAWPDGDPGFDDGELSGTFAGEFYQVDVVGSTKIYRWRSDPASPGYGYLSGTCPTIFWGFGTGSTAPWLLPTGSDYYGVDVIAGTVTGSSNCCGGSYSATIDVTHYKVGTQAGLYNMYAYHTKRGTGATYTATVLSNGACRNATTHLCQIGSGGCDGTCNPYP